MEETEGLAKKGENPEKKTGPHRYGESAGGGANLEGVLQLQKREN